MQSSLISKIEKARRYAQERNRIAFSSFQVEFRGEHDRHLVSYQESGWHCSCHFFSQRGLCSHTMALEKILEGMLSGKPLAPRDEASPQGRLIPE